MGRFGGDLEIAGLINWMKKAAPRGRQLLVRVYTKTERTQDHGAEGDLVCHFALLGAPYRVVEFTC